MSQAVPMWTVLTEHHVEAVLEAYPSVGWAQDALVVDEATNIFSTKNTVAFA